MISTITEMMTRGFLALQSAARREEGQNTLEYIVAVIFVVVAAAFAFYMFDTQIRTWATSAISSIMAGQ